MVQTRPGHAPQWSKWLFCSGVALCAIVATYWPHSQMMFRYDRLAISSGQVWRILSGHLVHLNAPHLFLNLAGLFLLAELIWNGLPIPHGLGLLVASSIGISLGFWLFHPELAWYAGLSGALHGLWAGCALHGMMSRGPRPEAAINAEGVIIDAARRRLASLLALLLLVVKLGIEWRNGPSTYAAQLIGAPVVTAAHLYGALIGGLYALVWRAACLLHRENNG